MSQMFIFVKKCVSLVLQLTMIVKNVVPLFIYLNLYIFILFEEIKLVISNHFDIVRLKTQSEKYMALKNEISKLVLILKK